jgi:hypothetical protein
VLTAAIKYRTALENSVCGIEERVSDKKEKIQICSTSVLI